MTLGIMGVLLLGGLSGCIFSPKKGDPVVQPPPEYLIPSTPQAVLHDLVLAYTNRDSVEYRKLLYAGYQGGSYKVDTTGVSGTFSRDDEIRHIQHMAEDHSLVTVDFDLGTVGTWIRTAGTGPKGESWAEIDIISYRLSLYYTGQENLAVVPGESFIFQFAPQTPAPSSPTDTLWSIGYWFELAPRTL